MSALCRFGFELAILAIYVPTLTAAESDLKSWNIDGMERHAIVYSPAKEDAAGSPLLLVFHGDGTNKAADSVSKAWHFNQCWPEAYVVFLQGSNWPSKKDPKRSKASWNAMPGIVGNRDLKFVDTVLADLKKEHHIDRRRIYAMGFSAGGGFVYLLWSERSTAFAAFAVCSGLPAANLKLRIPKPVFIAVGKADNPKTVKAVEDTVNVVRKLNDATADGAATTGGVTLYPSTNRAPVATLFHPAGHILPKEAPQLIVDFFRAQSLNH